ncbi:hypothetical protein Cgig2_033218 [Carnegiea gigantea]|uniref:Hexosyltransferase n=1 Tax=Carnegiea gigantea TaxID=171969 RepID=A0A9Q1QBE1_9CARY|nr:hypothetical protein Cgig2_033218 [Carnegiea gigantea]
MKLKIWVRKPVLGLLLVTVFAPIVLFTDKLSTFTSFSPPADLNEDTPTFRFSGDTGKLNVISKETARALKEPVGIVYSDGSAKSSSFPRVSNKEDTHKIRPLKDVSESQMDSEPVKHKRSRVLSATRTNGDGSVEDNPIRQITDWMHDKNGGDDLQKSVAEAGADKMNVTSHADIKHEELSVRKPDSIKVMETGTVEGRMDRKKEQKGTRTVMVQYIKDQLIRAKVYLSLTATRNNAHFIRELRQRIKELQKAFGDATTDSELPGSAKEKMKAMDLTLEKGQQIQDDCTAMVKKLRAILHTTEEQLRVHRKQTTFLTQLTAKTLPKGLHCLPLRLSTEYYMSNYSEKHFPNREKLDDPQLYHYAIFSDNILAAAVVVNSTVSNAKVNYYGLP